MEKYYLCQFYSEGLYGVELSKKPCENATTVQEVQLQGKNFLLVTVENQFYEDEETILREAKYLETDEFTVQTIQELTNQLDKNAYDDYHAGCFVLSVFAKKGKKGYKWIETSAEGFYDKEGIEGLYEEFKNILEKKKRETETLRKELLKVLENFRTYNFHDEENDYGTYYINEKNPQKIKEALEEFRKIEKYPEIHDFIEFLEEKKGYIVVGTDVTDFLIHF